MGFALGDGRLAVQTFYMISGFYMSLVWHEKYSKLSNPVRTFYISRALRIYPMYFAVLGVSLLMGIFTDYNDTAFNFLNTTSELGWLTTIWIYLTQFSLVGMETPLFIDFNLHKLMIVPVAWTLGLELSFYMLVPFLLPRMQIVVGLIIFSLTIRMVVALYGPSDDVALNTSLWSYRFFPFEIALFLGGALAQRIFAQVPTFLKLLLDKPEVYFLSVMGMVGGLCYFWLVFARIGEATYWLYYAMAFIGMAVLFRHTKLSKLESYIGELSYPMYLSHIPILWMVGQIVEPERTIYIVIPVTIMASMILCKMQKHIDQYRHEIVKTQMRSTR